MTSDHHARQAVTDADRTSARPRFGRAGADALGFRMAILDRQALGSGVPTDGWRRLTPATAKDRAFNVLWDAVATAPPIVMTYANLAGEHPGHRRAPVALSAGQCCRNGWPEPSRSTPPPGHGFLGIGMAFMACAVVAHWLASRW
jgi:hypothetical protein